MNNENFVVKNIETGEQIIVTSIEQLYAVLRVPNANYIFYPVSIQNADELICEKSIN